VAWAINGTDQSADWYSLLSEPEQDFVCGRTSGRERTTTRPATRKIRRSCRHRGGQL